MKQTASLTISYKSNFNFKIIHVNYLLALLKLAFLVLFI